MSVTDLERELEALGEQAALDDAAGRLVPCEWALYRHNAVKQEDLEAAFRNFMPHRKFLWEVRDLTRKGVWKRRGGALTGPCQATVTKAAQSKGEYDEGTFSASFQDKGGGFPRKVELTAAVNDSFGFGGHNVALAFTAA
jgi:hypothetical protein